MRQHKKSHGGKRVGGGDGGGKGATTELKIKSFRESDFGNYRCNIYSNSTKEEASSDVQVAGKTNHDSI